ncbi:phosphoglucosamine mutase [Halobiforma lacisalsi AJ5]|uniref:Phosphoglucosamine mutase n=1 Tax=Natronobacterium lacisalsi AJ5 TaxID=358396 RepID=M0LLQ7_NATLA|nr:phosphoglucosamine mutase [Halobiforma lacisalsi]APW97152.1 phosphoglucosamine mutase [Halobiforma lacisalsi AJ5]EMA34492.1 phosphoglucosamine mutase [Halobiforma lacisalsi AJ5]
MFGTSGIRGTVGEDVTADLALDVGRALASDGYEQVVVGRDVRESGIVMFDALTAGLRECGADVLEVGVASTPTVARAVPRTGADAGVVVTASHNPPTDNGIKLWSADGKAFDPDQRESIATRIEREAYDLQPWDGHGSSAPLTDAVDRHAAALIESVTIDDPPSVVVDVGNGTGEITARVLDELGCDVVTLNGQQDGSFPGRPSEPTRETLATLSSCVAVTDAQLGIAHDGDADRMHAVDGTGTFVPKDVLFALFAREAAENGDGDVVAAPVGTSVTVDDEVAAAGGSVSRTPVGDVHVAERAARSDAVFGGEPSGAWIWPEETPCPDGPLAACKLVELVAERGPLSELVADVDSYPIRRRSVEVADKEAVMERVRERVRDRYEDEDQRAEIDTRDGVYVDLENGWLLLRASGTEPVVRLTVEARTERQVERLEGDAVGILQRAIERFPSERRGESRSGAGLTDR